MMFRVNQLVYNRGEMKEVFFIAETKHGSLEELSEELARAGMIHFIRYDTRGPNAREAAVLGARRVRFVVDEYEAIMAKSGFTIITEPMEDVIGADGKPIFLLNEDAPPPRLEGVAQ